MEHFPILLSGLGVSVKFALVGFILGCVVGIPGGLITSFRILILSQLTGLFFEIMRGVPTIVLAMLLYFGLQMDMFPSGVVAIFVISSGCIAERVHNSITSAALRTDETVKITFSSAVAAIPKALPDLFAQLARQSVETFKETSVLMVIGVAELTSMGKQLYSRSLSIEGLLWAALLYLMLSLIIRLFAKGMEVLFNFVLKKNTYPIHTNDETPA